MDPYKAHRSKQIDSDETWAMANAALKHASAALYYGPPGTGKTYHAVHNTDGKAILRHTFTQDQPSAAILGHWVQRATPTGPQLEWNDGPALIAWRMSHTEPVRLVLDEMQKVGEDAQGLVHTLLDDEDSAAITLPTGETVRRGPHLQIVGTMNETPDELDPALRSRFRTKVFIGHVAPGALDLLPEALRNVVQGIIEGGTDPISEEGIRPWLGFVELVQAGVNVDRAAVMSFGVSRAHELADALKLAASDLGGVRARSAGTNTLEGKMDVGEIPDEIMALINKAKAV